MDYSRSDLDSTGNLDSSVESTHDMIPSKLINIAGNKNRQRDDSSGSDGYPSSATSTTGATKIAATKKNSNNYNTAYVSWFFFSSLFTFNVLL